MINWKRKTEMQTADWLCFSALHQLVITAKSALRKINSRNFTNFWFSVLKRKLMFWYGAVMEKKKRGKKFWLKNESATGLQYTSKQERDVKQETKGGLAARVYCCTFFFFFCILWLQLQFNCSYVTNIGKLQIQRDNPSHKGVKSKGWQRLQAAWILH